MAIELEFANKSKSRESQGIRGIMRRIFAGNREERRSSGAASRTESKTGSETKANAEFAPRGFYDRQERRNFENALARTKEQAMREGGFQ